MNAPEALDVRDLPPIAFGSRATLWWGILLVMMIEGTGFALLLSTYFYLRGNSEVWPPEGVRTPDMIFPVIGTALLLLSVMPTHLANRASLHAEVPRMRFWLIVATLLAILVTALRFVEFRRLPFSWYDHAYGSIFWATLGMHTIHVITGVFENIFLLLALFVGHVEKKRQVDVRSGGLYWYFMVFAWVPLFAVMYGERWL